MHKRSEWEKMFILDVPYLRRLSESLILIGSAMFGATFNLATRVGLR